MPLFQNMTKSRLLLDKRPGKNIRYSCDPKGSVLPNNKPCDWVEIDEEHMELPAIKACLEDKSLVPFSGKQMEDKNAAEKKLLDDEAARVKAESEAKLKAEKEAADAEEAAKVEAAKAKSNKSDKKKK